MYLLLNERVKDAFIWLRSSTFFVFAFHEPLMQLAQRLWVKLLAPNTDASILLFYFTIPILIIIAGILVHRFLLAKLPKVTAIITGGRSM